VTSPAQRPPPDNTQRSQERNIHASGGIRTHNSSMRGAADPRFVRRGHWDRRCLVIFSCRWTERRIALRDNRKLRVHGFQVCSRLHCKHFVYLSTQNGTYVVACGLVQRRRVLFVTKLSCCCEYKREGRNSIIHKCFCRELVLKIFEGERVEKRI
jgi:hypothetical protein